MNNCSFIGRVGKDAETRFTGAGKPVTLWSLAVDVGYGDKKTTLWLDCTLFGDRGEKVSSFITKGGKLGVCGELGAREHNGKTYITLNVREVSLLGGGKREDQTAPAKSNSAAPQREASYGTNDEDDIPFAPINRRSYL